MGSPRRGTTSALPIEREDNIGIVVWLIIGLIAGAIARLLVPGKDPLGFLGTLLLGLVGSVIGGFLGGLLRKGNDAFEPAGIIGSIIGAVIALLIYRAVAGRRGVGPAGGV